MDTSSNNTENDSLQQTNITHSYAEESTQPLKFSMQDVQEHFKKASQTILSRIDEMGSRIDQLEFMLNDLISEFESSSPLRENVNNQSDPNFNEVEASDLVPAGNVLQAQK